ncbi:Zinc finger protein bud20 [Erysiphe necator]|uniref:Putative zinc finger protein n=1 Tax=Uncinula necator TaxID=52586 RepID=A0A0B1P8A1_UNCNE|nr:Zinc finger protein bud20 [Erysiphe necator]KHJ34912.1 putative zinc finger protein [Erysiphe necator]
MAIKQKSTMTKTRRRLRDLDQISEDIHSPKHLEQYKNSKPAEDLPGAGLHYCIECAKWFESDNSLISHRKGSSHKRRLKALKETPYTQMEAEEAIGLRTDNGLRQSVQKSMEIDVES